MKIFTTQSQWLIRPKAKSPLSIGMAHYRAPNCRMVRLAPVSRESELTRHAAISLRYIREKSVIQTIGSKKSETKLGTHSCLRFELFSAKARSTSRKLRNPPTVPARVQA